MPHEAEREAGAVAIVTCEHADFDRAAFSVLQPKEMLVVIAASE